MCRSAEHGGRRCPSSRHFVRTDALRARDRERKRRTRQLVRIVHDREQREALAATFDVTVHSAATLTQLGDMDNFRAWMDTAPHAETDAFIAARVQADGEPIARSLANNAEVRSLALHGKRDQYADLIAEQRAEAGGHLDDLTDDEIWERAVKEGTRTARKEVTSAVRKGTPYEYSDYASSLRDGTLTALNELGTQAYLDGAEQNQAKAKADAKDAKRRAEADAQEQERLERRAADPLAHLPEDSMRVSGEDADKLTNRLKGLLGDPDEFGRMPRTDELGTWTSDVFPGARAADVVNDADTWKAVSAAYRPHLEGAWDGRHAHAYVNPNYTPGLEREHRIDHIEGVARKRLATRLGDTDKPASDVWSAVSEEYQRAVDEDAKRQSDRQQRWFKRNRPSPSVNLSPERIAVLRAVDADPAVQAARAKLVEANKTKTYPELSPSDRERVLDEVISDLFRNPRSNRAQGVRFTMDSNFDNLDYPVEVGHITARQAAKLRKDVAYARRQRLETDIQIAEQNAERAAKREPAPVS